MEQTQTRKFWETLKDNCIAEFVYRLRTMTDKDILGLLAIESLLKMKAGTFEGGYKLSQELERKCILAIQSTDIRCYQDLVRLCPEAFPKWIKDGNCTPELLDEGWALVKKA
jgi:hypothetical protein